MQCKDNDDDKGSKTFILVGIEWSTTTGWYSSECSTTLPDDMQPTQVNLSRLSLSHNPWIQTYPMDYNQSMIVIHPWIWLYKWLFFILLLPHACSSSTSSQDTTSSACMRSLDWTHYYAMKHTVPNMYESRIVWLYISTLCAKQRQHLCQRKLNTHANF